MKFYVNQRHSVAEFCHQKTNEKARVQYAAGMHETIAQSARVMGDFEVRTAALDEAGHGLTQAFWDSTDVLIWGHLAHDEVQNAVGERRLRVLDGVEMIVLHSALMLETYSELNGHTPRN